MYIAEPKRILIQIILYSTFPLAAARNHIRQTYLVHFSGTCSAELCSTAVGKTGRHQKLATFYTLAETRAAHPLNRTKKPHLRAMRRLPCFSFYVLPLALLLSPLVPPAVHPRAHPLTHCFYLPPFHVEILPFQSPDFGGRYKSSVASAPVQ